MTDLKLEKKKTKKDKEKQKWWMRADVKKIKLPILTTVYGFGWRKFF